ncbi:PAS/PAC sensor hybrid histidine kinase [Caballeronia arvi]|uniref:histidine kinase n=1 Tax=Caballeronia arvi TaxID=1777135 RepID=A0A158L1G2_9BURK|nr:PAS/PAC sensor hybrid histidine kinase [Caballeronia arvi]
MDLRYSPVTEDDGRPAGVIAIVIETTEKVLAEQERRSVEEKLLRLTQTLEERVAEAVTARVAAEERFRQVQKLEAIGNMTGGVAHDFNNVLQILSSNVELIRRVTGENSNLDARFRAMSSAISRGSKLASQMLAFARRQPLNPRASIRRSLDSMSELMLRALPESIVLAVSVAPDVHNVDVDRNQLENALLNRVINSRDAIDETGRIQVDVRYFTGKDRLPSGATLPSGEYVRLAVTDNGKGMSEAVRARMFEPFYSTKPEGHGTGLGLSMVFGFVTQSAGFFDVRTELGREPPSRSASRRATEKKAPMNGLQIPMHFMAERRFWLPKMIRRYALLQSTCWRNLVTRFFRHTTVIPRSRSCSKTRASTYCSQMSRCQEGTKQRTGRHCQRSSTSGGDCIRVRLHARCHRP